MKVPVFISVLFFITFCQFLPYIACTQVLQGVRICIDPGHGGHTSDDRQIFLPNGVVYWESEGDLATALHLEEILTGLGASVKLTRTDNTDESDITLSERSEIANAYGAHFFHSIHTNGGGGNYSLVLYKETNGNPAFPLAKEMGDIMAPNLQYLMKTEGNYNRGDYSFLGFNLGVLNFTNMPGTLSEASFHDLPEEGLRLKNDEYLKNYAWALARSFLTYFDAGGMPTGRVGGIITDVTFGAPVNSVTVSCNPGNVMYTGDDYYNGFYAIGDLPQGQYELTLSKEGYLDNVQNFTVSADQYLDLDLTIQYYNNGYPNVDFYMEGLPAGAGEQVIFNAEKSTDDGTIELFEWDFGDGSDMAEGMVAIHSFNQDGVYDITLIATDNEGKKSSVTKTLPIITYPPSAPRLLYIKTHIGINGIRVGWQKSPENNIIAYHVYASEDRYFNDVQWVGSVNKDTFQLDLPDFGETGHLYYFRVSAENMAGMEGAHGDTYCWMRSVMSDPDKKVLIVDGFNRIASYTGTTHDFTGLYGRSLQKLDLYGVESCSNYAIIHNQVDLSYYPYLFWFLGDESTADETFNVTEQSLIRAYLEQGGKLFVTGAETGWDLVAKGSVSDQLFYQDYLKTEYLADGGPGRSPATGLPGTGFEGVSLHFGQVYPEDYPDEIGERDGSVKILKYNNGAGAGISYKGDWASTGNSGALVNIGFPLESVGSASEAQLFIKRLMAFFDPESTQNDPVNQLEPMYVFPTVCNEMIGLYAERGNLPDVQIRIYDLEGRLHYEDILPGNDTKMHRVDLHFLQPGLYFLGVESGTKQRFFRFLKM